MTDKRTLIVRLRSLNYALSLTRFNLIILVASAILLYIDQGQDLLHAVAEDNEWLALLGGGLLWALSIWYWARVLLDIRFPDPPVSQADLAWARTYLPRIMGVAAFVALAWNLYRAVGLGLYVVLVVLCGTVFYFMVHFRRPLAQGLARRLSKDDPHTSWFWVDDIDNYREQVNVRWQDDIKEVWRRTFVMPTTLLGLLLFFWGMISPLTMGFTFNTLVLLFLWGATFLPIGSVITYIGSRNGYPLFAVLIALAFVFSLFNDNHAIRKFGESKPRPSLDSALELWTQQQQCSSTSCPPLVVAATAGGGIRAAYWTGTVLGNLDDEMARQDHKPLRENLFAISGVSGGSVGASVYRSAIEAGVPRKKMMESVQKVLAQDFLTPLAAGLLYPDILQRFMPFNVFEDRATVFEQGLEAGFKRITKQPLMENSFTELTSMHNKSWPALFLNSTWSNNGRRIVAANYKIPAEQRLYADLIDNLGYDIRLSTAAHNSARFPFASPPGSWELALDEEQEKDFKTGRLRQRLQDGGLFENYGAETALEILYAAKRYFKRNNLYFDPMVILISSDPTLPKNIGDPQIKKQAEFGYEVLTTLRTYGATRVGRGAEAASRLENWIKDEKRFAYFRMCDGDEESPPLGWALSETAQTSINGYLIGSLDSTSPDCRKDNQEARSKVLNALAAR